MVIDPHMQATVYVVTVATVYVVTVATVYVVIIARPKYDENFRTSIFTTLNLMFSGHG